MARKEKIYVAGGDVTVNGHEMRRSIIVTRVGESVYEVNAVSCVIIYDDVRHSRELCDPSEVSESRGVAEEIAPNRWKIIFDFFGSFKEDTEYEFLFASS